MSSSSLHYSPAIADRLRRWVTEVNIAPHAVAGYAQLDDGEVVYTVGAADDNAERIFDLASVSKPFVAVLSARLVTQGLLSFSAKLEDVLPEVRGTWAGAQTVESLLSHRAGLLPHLELFAPSWSGYPVRLSQLHQQAASARQPDLLPNSAAPPAVYSDLGYILVGAALEHVMQKPLDHLLHEYVLAPWALPGLGSSRSIQRYPELFAQVAPTELQKPRGGLLQGVVHDDNSWALAGTGLSGHAGLFGNAEGLLRFGVQLLKRTKEAELAPLLERRPSGSLRMGFDGISGTNSLAGACTGADTFGHLGFTGTSMWCDPTRGRVTVLLSNRVYPHRGRSSVKLLRPKMHDFLWNC